MTSIKGCVHFGCRFISECKSTISTSFNRLMHTFVTGNQADFGPNSVRFSCSNYSRQPERYGKLYGLVSLFNPTNAVINLHLLETLHDTYKPRVFLFTRCTGSKVLYCPKYSVNDRSLWHDLRLSGMEEEHALDTRSYYEEEVSERRLAGKCEHKTWSGMRSSRVLLGPVW